MPEVNHVMHSRFTHRFAAGAGAAVCAAALLFAHPASAQTEAISSFTSVTSFDLANLSVGYTFTVNQTITVTELGYFDFNVANGLVDAHQLAIYSPTGTQIINANIAGTGGVVGNTFRPDGSTPSAFRYAGASSVNGGSVVLTAGNTYTIAGFTGTTSGVTADQFFSNATGLTTSPIFTYGVNRFATGALPTTSAGFTTLPQNGTAYFGPDFRFTVGNNVVGPEPGTVALLATGLLGMGGIRLRSRRRSKKAAK